MPPIEIKPEPHIPSPEEAKLYKGLLILLLVPFVMFIHVLIEGYVVMKLWLWLLIPIFHFAPITLWQGAGMSLFVFFVVPYHGEDMEGKSHSKIMNKIIKNLLLKPACTLIVALFLSQYV